jgi:hypothetical protein
MLILIIGRMGIVNHRYTRKNRVRSGASSLAASSSGRGSGVQEPLHVGLQSLNTMIELCRDLRKESSPNLLLNFKKLSSDAKSSLCAAKNSTKAHLSINVAKSTMKCWTNHSHLI